MELRLPGGRSGLWRDALLLFAVAIAVRAVVSLLQVLYGLNGIPGSSLSTWSDFYTGYVQWLGFLQKGLMPYRDFYTYKYTPLFIYTLFPFFAAGGSQAASIPIVVSDAATAVLVYLVVRPFGGRKVALAAGLLYAFAPFILYYEDYLWLSCQPMTFFLLLSVYLLNDGRPTLSFASLAASVMFRQEALFILPAYLVLYLRSYRSNLGRGLVAFAAVLFAVSLPLLIAAPIDYISSINYLPSTNSLLTYLGHYEPSVPAASAIVNTGVFEPNTVQGCQITTLQKLYTGTICGSVVNLKEFAAYLLMGRVNEMANFLEPLLFVLLLPLLYVARRWPNFPQILCTYSLLIGLVLFSDYVEASLAYYFIPVYALMFAAVADRRTLALAVGAAALSLVVPEGPFQSVLPIGYLFALISLQDISLRGRDSMLGQGAGSFETPALAASEETAPTRSARGDSLILNA